MHYVLHKPVGEWRTCALSWSTTRVLLVKAGEYLGEHVQGMDQVKMEPKDA